MLLKRKAKRRVFAWITDSHAGKDTGLLNPATVLVRTDDKGHDEEWQPEPSQTQRWLWPVYENAIGELEEYAGGDEIIVAHAGDITHGDRHGNVIPGTFLSDQRIIAYDNMLPILELKQVKKGRFLTGTEVHVPQSAEARVVARLRRNLDKDIACCHHARFDMGQDVVDAAHHGPAPGSRHWLKGNVARFYLRDRIYEDRALGKEPAIVYIRGHYHRYVPEVIHDRWASVERDRHLIVVPALSGLDGYIRKIIKSTPIIEAGIVALEFIDGYLEDVKAFIELNDMRTEEAL
jgi:hypothetical protein